MSDDKSAFNLMKIIHLSSLNFRTKLIPPIVSLLLIIGCSQGAVDPELRLGMTMLIAIVSFIVIYTRPILGVYAVAVISTTFSPAFHIGFANLYFHQWVILVALLASISSGLILENFDTKIKSGMSVAILVFVGSLLLSISHTPNMAIGIKSFLYIGVLIASYYLVLLCMNREKHIKVFIALLVIATSVVCIISFTYHSSGRLGSLVLRNPNSFGNFLALIIPFGISLLLCGRFERGKKLILAFCLCLMFVNLVLTFSRSAWVGVFISIVSLFIFRPKVSLILLVCGMISAVFFFVTVKQAIAIGIGLGVDNCRVGVIDLHLLAIGQPIAIGIRFGRIGPVGQDLLHIE